MITDIDSHIRHMVSQAEIISEEQETRLVRAWQEKGDLKARNDLIKAHYKLVAGMATSCTKTGAPFSDLFNEGAAALAQAADKFDPEMQSRFSTFASWLVLSRLQDAIHVSIYNVKIGRTHTEKTVLRLLGTARNIMGAQLDPQVIEEIAEMAGCDPKVVERLDAAVGSRGLSLNNKVGGDGDEGVELGDQIEDVDNEMTSPHTLLLTRDQRALLEKAFSELKDPRAAEILRIRWLSEKEMTFREIGEKFGVGAERIRQIERAAFAQLRFLLSNQSVSLQDLLT